MFIKANLYDGRCAAIQIEEIACVYGRPGEPAVIVMATGNEFVLSDLYEDFIDKMNDGLLEMRGE